MKSKKNDYNEVFPSGVCRMGNTDVTYYRIGNRLWFDKKQTEKVLTGKNQHNILGMDKDQKNHSKIFDLNLKRVVEIISKTGAYNYLKTARSVKDENRFTFYSGVKNIEAPKQNEQPEPLQMPMFEAKTEEPSVNQYVNISQDGSGMEIHCRIEGKNSAEKNNNLVKFLLSVANEVMNGNIKIMPVKDVA